MPASGLPLDLDAMESLPTGGGAMVFDFRYRGFTFVVRTEETGDGTARLRIAADLGHMPFSAEAPAARSGLSAIILHGNGLLGRTFSLAEERILLDGEIVVETPVTASRLLTALAKVLIPVSPYLDLIALYFEPGGQRLRQEWRRPSRPVAPPKALRAN